MLTLSAILNPLLMLALPLALGLFLARRLGLPWRLYLIGAATFIGSQFVHIPLNVGLDRLFDSGALPVPPEAYHLLFNAVVLGLSAGLCEEIARFVVYRWWIKSARSWREALMFGAGHGGVESFITGLLVALSVVNLLVLANTDLTTLPLTPEQMDQARQVLAEFRANPWYFPLLGALERVFAMTFHLSAAVLVLQVFRRRNILWLLVAILWHAALNAIAVYVAGTAGVVWTEAALFGLTLVSLGIIIGLRRGEPFAPISPTVQPAEPLPMPATSTLDAPALTTEALEKTRYQR
jgi:uncharacterized membrane protein YhfC